MSRFPSGLVILVLNRETFAYPSLGHVVLATLHNELATIPSASDPRDTCIDMLPVAKSLSTT